MRNIIVAAILMLSFASFSQKASVTNPHPKRGDNIVITYMPDTAGTLSSPDELYVDFVLHKENFETLYARKKMDKVPSGFELRLTVDSLASYYSFSFFTTDVWDRENKIEVIPLDKKGRRFRNSYLEVASFDEEAVIKERKAFPENFVMYVPRWRSLSHKVSQDSVKTLIEEDLKLIESWVNEKDRKAKESAFYALMGGNLIIKDFDKAYKYYDLLLSNYPGSYLVERAYTMYSYYLFSYSEKDDRFEKRSIDFLKAHPLSAIGKKLIWKLDDSEESRNIMYQFTKHWMEKEPEEVTHYFMHTKSLTDNDEKKKYLSKAVNVLLDKNLSVTHYYDWTNMIPRRLPRIMEGYLEAEGYAEALALAVLLEENSTNLAANIFEIKGKAYQGLHDYDKAFESYLEADFRGSHFANDSAKAIFAYLDEGDDFETFKKSTKRRMFYEAEVDRAPEFSVVDMQGNNYSLADLEGKVVVINFWYIGCAPCIVEIPRLNELVNMYEGKEVVFLAFALNEKATLEKFLEKKEFKYNIVPSSNDIADKFNISGYPTHIILDKKGNIRSVFFGATKEPRKDLIPTIDEMLQY